MDFHVVEVEGTTIIITGVCNLSSFFIYVHFHINNGLCLCDIGYYNQRYNSGGRGRGLSNSRGRGGGNQEAAEAN